MPRIPLIIANQALTVSLGILGIVLLTHFVEETVLGPYLLFLTLTQIGPLLTHSGLVNHTSRYWQREQPKALAYLRFLWRDSLQRGIILGVILAGAVVVLSWKAQSGLWLALLPLLFMSNFGLAWFSLAGLALNASERHGALLTLSVLAAALRAVWPVLAGLILGMTVFWLSFGFFGHVVVAGGCIWMLLVRPAAGEPADAGTQGCWQRELRQFGRPFLWIGAGNWLFQFADQWIVEWFHPGHLGEFGVAIRIALTVPSVISAGLMQWAFPRVFREADRAKSPADWQALVKSCDRYTALFVVAGAGALVVLSWIMPWLVGDGRLVAEKYRGSIAFLIPAGISFMAVQVNQFHYLLLQGQHNSGGIVRVMVITAGLKTVGSIAAAAYSWTAFLLWLPFATLLVALLGRFLIQAAIRRGVAAEPPPA